MRFVSAAGICTALAITAGSSGITVPYATAGDAAFVGMDSAVGESDAMGCVVAVSVGGATFVSVDSRGGAQPARQELAAIRLPVTDAISFNASRRDSLPSV